MLDEDGLLIGYTIEDVTAAMLDEGWLLPRIWRTDWSAIPGDGTAASLVKSATHKGGQASCPLGSLDGAAKLQPRAIPAPIFLILG